MKQTAKIKELEGEFAIIEVVRASACSSCKSNTNGDCHACSMFQTESTVLSKASNSIGGQVGDVVEIETPSSLILGYAALVFLLPIASGLLFYGIGTWFPLPIWFPYILSLIGFGLSFLPIYFLGNKKAEKTNVIKIMKIVGSGLPIKK